MLEELFGLGLLLVEALVLLVVLLTIFIVREARRPPRHTAGYAVARGMAVDPEDAGLQYTSWMHVCADGAELPVWEICRGPGARHTAVFVHGWGQSRIDMLARIEPFQAMFDRIVLYELRGHGDTEGHRARLGDREELDLIALLQQLGAGSFHLIGCSMGANVALAAAAMESPMQSRIAGVISYGAYLDFHSALRGRLRAAALPTRPMTDLAMLWFRLRGLQLRPLLPLTNLACPVLLFHGQQDRIVPPSHARIIADALPNVTVKEVEEAAHGNVHLAEHGSHDQDVRSFLLLTQELADTPEHGGMRRKDNA